MEKSLEDRFKEEYNLITPQINEKVKLAKKYLEEAIELSKKHGIPFKSGVTQLSDRYFPKSFQEMWNLDEEELENYGLYYGGYAESGWQQSRRC